MFTGISAITAYWLDTGTGDTNLTTAIHARNLRKVYPGNPPVEALAGVDLEIGDSR